MLIIRMAINFVFCCTYNFFALFSYNEYSFLFIFSILSTFIIIFWITNWTSSCHSKLSIEALPSPLDYLRISFVILLILVVINLHMVFGIVSIRILNFFSFNLTSKRPCIIIVFKFHHLIIGQPVIIFLFYFLKYISVGIKLCWWVKIS